MSEDTESFAEASRVDAVTLEVVDTCMSVVDEYCKANNFDATAMIFMSVHVAAHLMARGLFFADGPEGRDRLRNKMMDNAAEILDSARQHIDQSERELNQSKIIRPN